MQPGQTAEQVFGILVRGARDARGWTQEELRKRLLEEYGVKLEKTAMIRLESGNRPIRFNEVVALSSLLDLDLAVSAFAPDQKMDDDEYGKLNDAVSALDEQAFALARDIANLDLTRKNLVDRHVALSRSQEMLRHRIALADRYRAAAKSRTPQQ